MKKIIWIILSILGIVVISAILAGITFGGGWNGSSWGMMGDWGPGMMHGWGFNIFGWMGMLLMWLIPIGFLALVVLGISALVSVVIPYERRKGTFGSLVETQPSAREILQMRYARGEITREQYNEMLTDIQ